MSKKQNTSCALAARSSNNASRKTISALCFPPSGWQASFPPSGWQASFPPSGWQAIFAPSGWQASFPPSGWQAIFAPSGWQAIYPQPFCEVTFGLRMVTRTVHEPKYATLCSIPCCLHSETPHYSTQHFVQSFGVYT